MIHAVFYENATDQLAATKTFLLQDRVFNMHQLRFLNRASNKDWRWGIAAFENHQCVASILCTTRNAIFVSPHAPKVSSVLADAIPISETITDLIGQRAAVRQLAEALNAAFQPFISGSLYALESPPQWNASETAGHRVTFRVAQASELAQITAMCIAFVDELSMKETREQTIENAARRVPLGHYALAARDGTDIATAGGTYVGDGIGSIGPVYVVPEMRARGLKLGQAITAFTCERLIAQGATLIVLMADQENPVSNAAYQRLGFVNRGAFDHLERVSGEFQK